MFKLIPAAKDFSICWRCQYRLSLRGRPRSTRQRPAEHPQQHRRFTSGPSLRQQQISSSYDASIDNGNLERAPIRYYTEGLRPNQKHIHGNEAPTKDSLGLSVLGEPAEVLILRDKEDRFRLDSNVASIRASGPDKNPAQESISSAEMLEEMDAERGTVDIDDVCKNIESVRELWATETGGSVTGVAYKDLVSRLREGFTKQQLGAYFDRAGKDQAADVFDLNVESSNNLYARSSWQLLGVTPVRKSKAPRIADPNEKEVPGKEPGQGPSKDVLVKRILRYRWKITPRSQESSLGELDLRLQKPHLDLILKHKRDILKLISKSYDSKVEAWPQDRIIRITSDYDSCVDILKFFVHTLESIRVSTIDGQESTPFPKKLNDVVLRQIEEYTNTIFRPYAFSRNKVSTGVFYLGPDEADLLETRRLIHQILRPASAQNLGIAWSKGGKFSTASPAPVKVGSRLSLAKRNQQWSRWYSPQKENLNQTKREKDGSPPSISSAESMAKSMHGKLAFDTVRTFFKVPEDDIYELYSKHTQHWMSEIKYHDSVKLGQVLFPAKMAGSILDTFERNRGNRIKQTGRKIRVIDSRDIGLKSSRMPREFLPLVPGLVRSLESFRSLEKSEEFWEIRLSPSSSSKNASLPVPVEALPEIEIRIFLDHEKKKTSIKDVRLVNAKKKDFLQPQNVVDLRFVRKQCIYAKDKSVDPRIATFLRDSNVDIWGTELLKTPPGLSLSIPALAIQPHKGFDPTSYDETLPVDYISLGLEQRSSLAIPYQDPTSWPTLTYTRVEAGRIGGRRDELSLHNLTSPSKQLPASSAASTNDNSLSSTDHTSILFRKVAALVDTIELAGKGQSGKGLRMPEIRRWRNVARKTVRMVRPLRDDSRPGYVPPVNETVRRVVADRAVRPGGGQVLDGG